MVKFPDLVREFTSTTGLGNFVLTGAVPGFSSFATAGLAPGVDTFYYSCINLANPTQREVGTGVLNVDGTIARTPLNGAAKTNFSAGLKTVAITVGSEWYDAVEALLEAGPGGGAPAWGTLTGDIGDQTDLVAAFAGKLDTGAAAGFQPIDADLTAIAALATSAYGRGFLTVADAAAGRTKLALGDIATIDLSGDAVDVLYGDGTWAPPPAGGGGPVLDPLTQNIIPDAAYTWSLGSQAKLFDAVYTRNLQAIGANCSITIGDRNSWPNGWLTFVLSDVYLLKNNAGTTALTISAAGNATFTGTVGGSNLSGTNTGDETSDSILTTLGDWITPEEFGADGDGVTDDTAAFTALSAAIQAAGRAYIRLRGGANYLVGAQTAGAGGMYQQRVNGIDAVGLDALVIEGNGAKITTKGGLKFGSFNPADGTVVNYTDVSPAPNSAKADIGYTINAEDCGFVHITNLELDGNSAAQVLGGTTSTGDTETKHSGMHIIGCLNVVVHNVNAHHFLLDCWYISADGLLITDAPRPHSLSNCTGWFAGRNTVSFVGGNALTTTNCKWGAGGAAPKAGGGYLKSAPASAFDIEAQGSVIRNFHATACLFEQGPNGTSPITSGGGDSADCTFEQCDIIGAPLFGAPRMRLNGCRLFGYFAKLYGDTDPANATIVRDSFITDATLRDTPLQGAGGDLLVGGSTPTNAQIINSTIDVSRLKPTLPAMLTNNVTMFVRIGTDSLASGANLMSFGTPGVHNRMKIIDAIVANAPASPYVLQNPGSSVMIDCELVSATPHIQWVASSSTGFTGKFDNNNPTSTSGTTTNGDAAVTLLPRSSKRTQRWNTALTANRAVTLSTSNARDGDYFDIIRTAAASGAFNLNVGTGPLVSLAPGQRCRVIYDGAGAAWIVASYDALDPAGIPTGSVTRVMLANAGAAAILGATAAGAIGDLTPTVVTAMLNAATQALQGMMSAQDKTRLDTSFAFYRTIMEPSGSHIAARVAGTYGFGHGDPLAISGTGTLYPLDVLYIDPADFPAIGTLTAKLRLRISQMVNDVAPTGNYTYGLHPVTRPGTSGGAGLNIYTIGAAIAGSTVQSTTPAADSITNLVGADFALPAAGHYIIGMVSTATVAASSHMHMSANLQMHYT